MTGAGYSIVIATYERPQELARMLKSVAAQTRAPERVIVIDSSKGEDSRRVAAQYTGALPILYERSPEPSAARQRNQGAVHVLTPLVAFMDDDVVLSAELCETICAPFETDRDERIGGVAGRVGAPAPAPRGLLWWYYRFQAGYPHPTYGGRLFGPALHCEPTFNETDADLVPAQWLGARCVFFRTRLFQRELFPKFPGYSALADVHLSGRIARTHRLYFHRHAVFQHRDASSTWKRDVRDLARSRFRHQRLIARDVLEFTGPEFELKLLLHRLLVSARLLTRGGRGTMQELLGTWGI